MYAVSVSTATPTNVIGWWHLAATVTVTAPVSAGLESWTTPFTSAVPTTAVARSPPTMAVAPGMASPVQSSKIKTRIAPESTPPESPPRKPSVESL